MVQIQRYLDENVELNLLSNLTSMRGKKVSESARFENAFFGSRATARRWIEM